VPRPPLWRGSFEAVPGTPATTRSRCRIPIPVDRGSGPGSGRDFGGREPRRAYGIRPADRDVLAGWDGSRLRSGLLPLSVGIVVGNGAGMGIEAVQSTSAPSDAGERWPRWRVWTIRVWYGLLGLWALSMAQGVVHLILGDAGADERFTYVVVTAWKLLALGGVLGVSWTGGRSIVAFQAVVVGSVGWWGSELLYSVHPADDTPVASTITTVVLWLLPLVLLRPHRGELLRVHARPSAILLPLALIAAVPLCVYAVRQGDMATGLNGRIELYYVSTGLGLVLAVQAVFAGLRPRGLRRSRRDHLAARPDQSGPRVGHRPGLLGAAVRGRLGGGGQT
jgi:hypothetical protein